MASLQTTRMPSVTAELQAIAEARLGWASGRQVLHDPDFALEAAAEEQNRKSLHHTVSLVPPTRYSAVDVPETRCYSIAARTIGNRTSTVVPSPLTLSIRRAPP